MDGWMDALVEEKEKEKDMDMEMEKKTDTQKQMEKEMEKLEMEKEKQKDDKDKDMTKEMKMEKEIETKDIEKEKQKDTKEDKDKDMKKEKEKEMETETVKMKEMEKEIENKEKEKQKEKEKEKEDVRNGGWPLRLQPLRVMRNHIIPPPLSTHSSHSSTSDLDTLSMSPFFPEGNTTSLGALIALSSSSSSSFSALSASASSASLISTSKLNPLYNIEKQPQPILTTRRSINKRRIRRLPCWICRLMGCTNPTMHDDKDKYVTNLQICSNPSFGSHRLSYNNPPSAISSTPSFITCSQSLRLPPSEYPPIHTQGDNISNEEDHGDDDNIIVHQESGVETYDTQITHSHSHSLFDSKDHFNIEDHSLDVPKECSSSPPLKTRRGHNRKSKTFCATLFSRILL